MSSDGKTAVAKIDFYPGQRFSCQRCGFCCNSFEIKITAKELTRLKKVVLPSGENPQDDWFSPSLTSKGLYTVAKKADNKCVFIDTAGGCLLHNISGVNCKSLICRVFPVHMVNWADGRCSAELRFICPAVGSKTGTLLGDQPEIMDKIAKPLRERQILSDTRYSTENPASLRAVRQVHVAFKNILHDETVPLKTRLYSVSRIIAFHAIKSNHEAILLADDNFSADALEFVRKAAPVLKKELSNGVASLGDRIDFRILITGYLRDDDEFAVHSPITRLKKLCAHSVFAAGGGSLRQINPAAPDVSGRQCLARPRRTLVSIDALEVFCQFFYGKLDSMHFCGNTAHNFNYEMGIKHLLLSLPVTFVLAAAFVAQKEKPVIDRDDMLQAVRLMDLTFSRSPFFRLRLTRNLLNKLSKPATLAGLLNLIFGKPANK